MLLYIYLILLTLILFLVNALNDFMFLSYGNIPSTITKINPYIFSDTEFETIFQYREGDINY